MRFLIYWPDISGYMGACWRALAAIPGVQLRIVAYAPPSNFFATEVVAGLDVRLLNPQERDNGQLIHALAGEFKPDVLYTGGWFNKHYRSLMMSRELDSVARLLGLSTPWTGSWRQQFARLALRGLVKRSDRVIVCGERAWQYARALGFPERKIVRGLLSMDYPSFATVHRCRLEKPGGWPRRFLYIGRYAPEKGLDVLVDAYARYREQVSDPWPLACCGSGDDARLLRGQAGIEDMGFRQPQELPSIMADHGVLIAPSWTETWGVAIAESCAAGLPVICTEACGASVELIRPYHNGLLVGTGDAVAMARSMRWMHEHAELLAEMGERGQQLAASFSAELWARRWHGAAKDALQEKRRGSG